MKLNEKHFKCIELLIKGYRYTEIAKMIPCSRQAIYDWLDNPDFKRNLDECRHEIKNQAQNKILGKTDTYLDKIEELAFKSQSDNVKLNALEFLWETVYGKATTKIEQTNENKDKKDDFVNLDNIAKDIKENNIIELDKKKAK